MSFVYSYSKTMAGAQQVVVDEGLTIAPHATSKRDRLIEMSRRWNEAHLTVEHKPRSTARKARKPRRRRVALPAVVNIDVETQEAIYIANRHGMPTWARDIVVRVAKVRGVSPLDIVTSCRSRAIVPVRNEVFYVLRQTPSPVHGEIPSYPQIAKWFGRDHTGVLWGAVKHANANGLPTSSNMDLEKSIERKRSAALAHAKRARG